MLIARQTDCSAMLIMRSGKQVSWGRGAGLGPGPHTGTGRAGLAEISAGKEGVGIAHEFETLNQTASRTAR